MTLARNVFILGVKGMDFMDDICDGCFIKDRIGYCFTHAVENGENCPCVNCLIKVICSKACEDRINYSTKSVEGGRDHD